MEVFEMADNNTNNDRRPLGLAEAETVWYNHSLAVQEAMNNDPYTNGGVIDSMNKFGYINAQSFGVGPGKMILEKYFVYEDIKFLSCFRLQTATLPEVKRFKELISRFEKYLSENAWETTMGNTVPGYTPSYNGWNNPNLFGGVSVQPIYGAPVPMEIPKEWMGETPSDISRRQMGPKNWGDYSATSSNDEVQKGPNEPDEQSSDEKTPSLFRSTGFPFPEKIGEKEPSFSSSIWNTKAGLAAFGIPAPPEPGFNRTSKSTRVVLSAEGISSKDDVQAEKKQEEFTDMVYKSISGTPGPVEPGQLKNASLKAILDYPSTGVVINENPVSLTEENKSVDKEDKD